MSTTRKKKQSDKQVLIRMLRRAKIKPIIGLDGKWMMLRGGHEGVNGHYADATFRFDEKGKLLSVSVEGD